MSHVDQEFVTVYYQPAFQRMSPSQKATAMGRQLRLNARLLLLSLFDVFGINPVSKQHASACSNLWSTLTRAWCDIHHIDMSRITNLMSGATLIAHLCDHRS
jgi:hypothetical protein